MLVDRVTGPGTTRLGQVAVLVGGMAFYATAISWLGWKCQTGGPYEWVLSIVVVTVLGCICGVIASCLWKIWLTGRGEPAEPPPVPQRGKALFAETGHELLFRPLVKTGPKYWVFILFFLSIMGWGAWGYFHQVRDGLGVTGLSKPYFWGVYLTNFVFFIGISHAGTLISAILRVTHAEWRRPITRAAEAITVFALCIGAPQVLIDLGRIDRLTNVLEFGRFQSPLLWDVCCITTYLVGSVTYLWLPLIPDVALIRDRLPGSARIRRLVYGVMAIGWHGTERQKHALERAIGFMAVIIIPIAVSVHTVVSWIFGMTIQPMWHSTILGPYFVIGAIFTGIASLLIAMAILRKVYHLENYFKPIHFNNLAVLLIAMILLWAYATLSEYLTTFYGNEPSHMSVFYSKFTREFAPVFWTMVVCCLVIPLPILAIKRFRTITGCVIASIAINIGMWLERYTIVVPTLSHPRLPYRVTLYSPTWVEWSITAASFAAMFLLYALFVKVFPIVAVWEIDEEVAERAKAATPRRAGHRVRVDPYLTTATPWMRRASRREIRAREGRPVVAIRARTAAIPVAPEIMTSEERHA